MNLIFLFSFSDITNEWSALACVAFCAFGALKVKNDTHTKYAIAILGSILGIAIMFYHNNQTELIVTAKSESEQKLYNEKYNNLNEKFKQCDSLQGLSQKSLASYNTVVQNNNLEKVRIANQLNDLKIKNKSLTSKLKEFENKYNFPCNEGYCISVDQDTEKYGYKDQRDHLVIPHKFLGASSFYNGRAGVLNKSKKWGFIDYSGVAVIGFEYDRVQRFEKDGTAIVYKNGKKLRIDKNGIVKKIYPNSDLVAIK